MVIKSVGKSKNKMSKGDGNLIEKRSKVQAEIRKRSGPQSRTSVYLGVTQILNDAVQKDWKMGSPHMKFSSTCNSRAPSMCCGGKKGRQLHLGSFPAAIPAASLKICRAYDRAAFIIRPDTAVNFPDTDYSQDEFIKKHGNLGIFDFVYELRMWAQSDELANEYNMVTSKCTIKNLVEVNHPNNIKKRTKTRVKSASMLKSMDENLIKNDETFSTKKSASIELLGEQESNLMSSKLAKEQFMASGGKFQRILELDPPNPNLSFSQINDDIIDFSSSVFPSMNSNSGQRYQRKNSSITHFDVQSVTGDQVLYPFDKLHNLQRLAASKSPKLGTNEDHRHTKDTNKENFPTCKGLISQAFEVPQSPLPQVPNTDSTLSHPNETQKLYDKWPKLEDSAMFGITTKYSTYLPGDVYQSSINSLDNDQCLSQIFWQESTATNEDFVNFNFDCRDKIFDDINLEAECTPFFSERDPHQSPLYLQNDDYHDTFLYPSANLQDNGLAEITSSYFPDIIINSTKDAKLNCGSMKLKK